jgi:hypothetical protein
LLKNGKNRLAADERGLRRKDLPIGIGVYVPSWAAN